MPTKTFFNLSDEKRNRLVDSATKEFSEKSLNKASINTIIKHAGISRGSFYQYFENKEDLYFYIVKKIRSNSEKLFKEEIEKAEGDIFVGFRNYFPQILAMMMEKNNVHFFKQLFLHMDYRATTEVAPEELTHAEEGAKDVGENTFNLIYRNQLQVNSIEELNKLMRLINSIMMHEIIEGFAREYSQEKIGINFYQKLNWLEFGAKKDKRSGGNK